MMTRACLQLLSISLLAAALVLPSPALAKKKLDRSHPKATKVGVGLGLESGTSLMDLYYFETGMFRVEPLMSSTTLRLPILASGGWRIEPEVGLLHLSYEGESFNDWKLATGIYPCWGLGEDGLAYAGGRIGLTGQGDDDDSYKDLLLGFGAGGEYWVSSYFTVGGEVQLNYVKYGEDMNGSSITTNAALLARFYFN